MKQPVSSSKDRTSGIGCALMAVLFLVQLGYALLNKIALAKATVFGLALFLSIGIILLSITFAWNRWLGLPLSGRKWPKRRGDLSKFFKETFLVSMMFAYLILLAGILLFAAHSWLSQSTVREKLLVLGGVGVLVVILIVRSTRKQKNQRRALALLKGGPAGIAEWNSWRFLRRNPLRELIDPLPDLKRVDLSKVDLSGADLTWVHLQYADLSFCNLTGARLEDAHLSHAILRDAILPKDGLPRDAITPKP